MSQKVCSQLRHLRRSADSVASICQHLYSQLLRRQAIDVACDLGAESRASWAPLRALARAALFAPALGGDQLPIVFRPGGACQSRRSVGTREHTPGVSAENG